MRPYRSFFLAAALIVVLLVVAGCTDAPASPTARTAGADPSPGDIPLATIDRDPSIPLVSITDSEESAIQVDVVDGPPPDVGVVTPRTGLVSVVVEGGLATGEAAEIRWPIPGDWEQNWEPVVVWEDGSDGWRWLPTERTSGPDGEFAVAQTVHFSRGFLASFDPGGFARELADEAAGLFSGRAGAQVPVCEGADVIGDLVKITSDAVDGVGQDDAVLWCAGVQAGQPVLKVTNNRRILAQVLIPANATVIEQENGISLTKGAAQLGASIEFLAQGLPQDRTVLLLEKGATITIQVPQDEQSGVEVSASAVGYALSGLVLGLDTYTSIAGAAGVRTTASSGDLLHLLGEGSGSAEDWAQAALGCLRDFTEIYTDDMTAAVDLGAEVERGLGLLVSCGMKIGAASVDDSGPLGWFIAATVSTISALLSLAVTALELLVAVIREAVDAIFGEEGAVYTVLTMPVQSPAPAADVRQVPSSESFGFTTSTGAVSCDVASDMEVACGSRTFDAWVPPPRPDTCEFLGWGHVIGVTDSYAGFYCSGTGAGSTASTSLPTPAWFDPEFDTIYSFEDGFGSGAYAPAPGTTITNGVFSCRVDAAAVVCSHVTGGHGFAITETTWEVFE